MNTKEWHNYCNRKKDLDACIQAYKDMNKDVKNAPLFKYLKFEKRQAYRIYKRAVA